MNRKLLSKILIVLSIILVVLILSYFIYQLYQNEVNTIDSRDISTEQRNVLTLKNNTSSDEYILKEVNKENNYINVVSEDSSEELQPFSIDDSTLLICFEDRESLQTVVDFSRLNSWSDSLFRNFLESNQDFVNKYVKLVTSNDIYVSVIMVGGCE